MARIDAFAHIGNDRLEIDEILCRGSLGTANAAADADTAHNPFAVWLSCNPSNPPLPHAPYGQRGMAPEQDMDVTALGAVSTY